MSGNSGRVLDASGRQETSTLDTQGEIKVNAEGNVYSFQYNILVYMLSFSQ